MRNHQSKYLVTTALFCGIATLACTFVQSKAQAPEQPNLPKGQRAQVITLRRETDGKGQVTRQVDVVYDFTRATVSVVTIKVPEAGPPTIEVFPIKDYAAR